jgi:HEAT repeat protein
MAVALLPAPAGWRASGQTPTTAPAVGPSADRAEALQFSRDVIAERNNTPRARRGEAERLIKYRWPEAIDLAIELLKSPDASTRLTVCDGIASVGMQDPSVLDGHLVDPLVVALGDPEPTVAAKAAQALSCFRDGGVAPRLGVLAADGSAPLPQRLSAIDALAPNIGDRRMIEQLIGLLDVPSEEIRTRALAALAPAAAEDLGRDVNRWKQWWEAVARLDERQWLEGRVRLFSQRNRTLQNELNRVRTEAEQRSTLLSKRLEEALREGYRLIGDAQQRQDALLAWLREPVVEVRLIAMAIISGQIQDGTKPSDSLRTELKTHFADESAEVRRRALLIVGALNDPADAEAILARLSTEKDPAVREVALRVLGQLPTPASIPLLIAEIRNPDAPVACVAEAAKSLGLLALDARARATGGVADATGEQNSPGRQGLVGKGTIEASSLAEAVEPLKLRYAAAPAPDLRLRESLLVAMAQIGDPSCSAEFVSALDSTEPQILASALVGIKAIGGAHQLSRLMALTEHSDARVRQRAIEALASLGSESVHLERLAARLNPAVEPSDACRQAAWVGFRQLLKTKAMSVRLEWSDRLKTLPDLQRDYLEELAAEMAGQNPPRAELRGVRRRLAESYAAAGHASEVLPHWIALYKALAADGDPEAIAVGQSALGAALAARRNDACVELVTQLLASADATLADAVIDALDESMRSLAAAGDVPAAEALRAALRSVPTESCPPGLQILLNGEMPPAPASNGSPVPGP